ncbi:MAG: hypothetical protein A2420_01235 [Candidatus Moranbacteria bacterium RIFOXYC1_FULL_44_13]|nr:MAG: hypothetical protein A2420_01235 [Candidatus Moranbacteria bacterium RIFOXYC1_FULL_44_13]
MGKLKTVTVSFFRASKERPWRLVLLLIILTLIVLYLLNIKASKKLNTSCVVSGCNSEICQNKDDEPMASICLWNKKFTCYKNAKCEAQKDNTCGWTMDQNLTSCLSGFN